MINILGEDHRSIDLSERIIAKKLMYKLILSIVLRD